MNILILGAAGATGRLCVDECLARGHKVGAFVHNSALRNAGERLETVRGDLRHRADIAIALEGRDAVVSTFADSTPMRRFPDIVEACSTMDSNVPRPTSKRRIDGAGRAFGDLDLDAVDLTPAVAHSTKRCPASVNRAPADRRRISHVLSSLAASGCGCSSMASLD